MGTSFIGRFQRVTPLLSFPFCLSEGGGAGLGSHFFKTKSHDDEIRSRKVGPTFTIKIAVFLEKQMKNKISDRNPNWWPLRRVWLSPNSKSSSSPTSPLHLQSLSSLSVSLSLFFYFHCYFLFFLIFLMILSSSPSTSASISENPEASSNSEWNWLRLNVNKSPSYLPRCYY